MKKIAIIAMACTAISAPAFAADIAPAPVMDWNGFYVGAFAGGGWGSTDIEGDPRSGHGGGAGEEETVDVAREQEGEGGKGMPVLDLDADVDGFLGGFQAGYDFQHEAFLLGVVGDFAFSGISGDVERSREDGGHGGDVVEEESMVLEEGGMGGMGGNGGPPAAFDMDYNWIATLRARAGFLPMENWLLYATGGVAWAGIEFESTVDEGPLNGLSNDETDFGYAIGGGTEVRFTENWSLFAEALYMNFGDNDLEADKGPWSKVNYDNDIWTVKGGINFRLN